MSFLPRWREMNQRQSSRSWIPWAIFTVAFLVVNCVAQESVTFSQAEEMFQQRRYSEAAAAFERIERTSPGNSDALLFLAKSFINLGRFAEAGTALDSYCAKHPQSDDALYLLAYVRFRENKPAESLRFFTQAARLKPPVADDFKIIGLDYALLDDNQSAARYLKRAVAMQPNNVEARYYLGRALYLENQFDECISVFEEVLRQDPTSVKAQDNLGLAWEGNGQLSQSHRHGQKISQTLRAAISESWRAAHQIRQARRGNPFSPGGKTDPPGIGQGALRTWQRLHGCCKSAGC